MYTNQFVGDDELLSTALSMYSEEYQEHAVEYREAELGYWISRPPKNMWIDLAVGYRYRWEQERYPKEMVPLESFVRKILGEREFLLIFTDTIREMVEEQLQIYAWDHPQFVLALHAEYGPPVDSAQAQKLLDKELPDIQAILEEMYSPSAPDLHPQEIESIK